MNIVDENHTKYIICIENKENIVKKLKIFLFAQKMGVKIKYN